MSLPKNNKLKKKVKMKIHTALEQGTEEWFAVKLGKLSASKAQAIAAGVKKEGKIGAGLKTLCYEKAAEFLSGTRQDTYTNPHMERGNEQEALARASYELTKGVSVDVVGFIEADDSVGCSPDGLVGEDGMVEIKCPTNTNFVKLLHTQKIETGYVWQMQMQMFVAGRKWVDYVVFNEHFEELNIIRVERDEDKFGSIERGIEAGKAMIAEILAGVKVTKIEVKKEANAKI